MRSEWGYRKALLGTLLCAVLVLGISGCGTEVPVLSSGRSVGEETLWEQQDWAVLQIEQVIAISGTTGKWKGDSDAEPNWDESRQRILDESERSSCTLKTAEVGPAQLLVDVWADRIGEGLFASAERVRAHWKSGGWTVTDVIRKEDTVKGNEIEFRADGADGSMLALSAIEGVRGGILSLTVQAACSSHPSVAW